MATSCRCQETAQPADPLPVGSSLGPMMGMGAPMSEGRRRLAGWPPGAWSTMPSMSVHGPSVGIVGIRYGLAHVAAFQANGCRVIAVCQRDQAGAKAVADRYGVPRIFADWEEMLDVAHPEVVVIATPPHLHHA